MHMRHVAAIVALILVTAAAASAKPALYWTDRDDSRIMACDLDGSNTRIIASVGAGPRGLEIDANAGRMYWAEDTSGRICSAKLDGSDIQTLVSGLSSPVDVALDTANQQMYYTQWSAGTICRAPMAGGQSTQIISTGPAPYGIAYADGKLYWADWYYTHQRISTANADGSNFHTLASPVLGPQGVTTDGQWVYYGDTDSNAIYRVRPDGTGNSKLADAVNPWGLTIWDGNLYFASQDEPLNVATTGHLEYVSLSGGPVQTLLTLDQRPWGVAVADVPEPATMSLLVLGALTLVRRRRR